MMCLVDVQSACILISVAFIFYFVPGETLLEDGVAAKTVD